MSTTDTPQSNTRNDKHKWLTCSDGDRNSEHEPINGRTLHALFISYPRQGNVSSPTAAT